jgi:hypothetical protein
MWFQVLMEVTGFLTTEKMVRYSNPKELRGVQLRRAGVEGYP